MKHNKKELLKNLLEFSDKFQPTYLDKFSDKQIDIIYEGFISSIKHGVSNIKDAVHARHVYASNAKNNRCYSPSLTPIEKKICIKKESIQDLHYKIGLKRGRAVKAFQQGNKSEGQYYSNQIEEYKRKIENLQKEIAELERSKNR